VAETAQQIIEKPTTGLPGRTPRSEFEKPHVGRARTKKEVRLILDASGSMLEPAAPDSSLSKAELTEQVLPLLVKAIAGYDSKAAEEQSDGSDDKGGVLTFLVSYDGPYEDFDEEEAEFDDPRFLGDVNESNGPEKIQRYHAMVGEEGMTFVKPVLEAAKLAYDTEFPPDSTEAAWTAIVDVFWTDGKASDPQQVENWLDDNAGPDHVIVAVITGYDDGAAHAYSHYNKIAQDNRYLTVVWLKGVTGVQEIVEDVQLAAGLIE
jgi:hypothetical protein